MHANIVKSALASHHIARYMNELTQERSRIHASIVISALGNYQIAGVMNKNTQKTVR